MDITLLYVSLYIIFGIFLRGETSPISSPPCRSKVCDDRPECPKSSCRCLFPSKIDCDVYYQCVSGKPYQYKCSPGLLFNAETLSCDYEENVNCTYGRTTESLPTSVPDVTKSSDESTKYTSPPSTQYPIITDDPSDNTTPDGSNTNDTTTEFNTASSTKVTEYPNTKTTAQVTDDFSTQSNEELSTITNHPSEESSTVVVTTTSSDPQNPATSTTTSYSDPTPDIIITVPTTHGTDETTIDFVVTDEIVTSVTADPTSDIIITDPTADVTNPTSGDVATDPTSKTTASDTTTDKIFTTSTSDVTDGTTDAVTDEIVTAVTADPTPDIIITETTSKTTVSGTTSDTGHTDDATNPSTDSEVTDQTTDKSIFTQTTEQTDLTTDVTITTPRPQEPTSTISSPTTTEENSTSEGYTSTGKPTTEQPTQEPSTNGITDRNLPFECPSRFGLYPDLFNCSTFYQCSHWTPYQKECPSHLHFNPSLTVCDFPERAGCDGETVLTTTSKDNPTTSTTTSEPTYCDCDSCDLPIPDDCDSYILCIERSATVMTCGEGLSYNPMTGTCDFRDHVICESSVRCPKPDGKFPYPYSCSHFMECENDAMFVKKCPDEMVYDLENERCSSSAVCEGTSIDTTTQTVTTLAPVTTENIILSTTITEKVNDRTTEQLDTSETTSPAEVKTTELDITETPSGITDNDVTTITAADGNTDEIQLSTESSTTAKSEETPPDGRTVTPSTEFDKTVTSSTKGEDITSKGSNEETELTSESPPTTNITPTESNEEENTTNSNQSTEDYTTIVESTTGDGSITSRTSNPDDVADTTYPSTLVSDNTSHQTISTTDATSNSDGGVGGTFKCPSRFGLYPDAKNCSGFYQCSHWVAHHKTCPSNLHFNPTVDVCDWPYRAGCGSPPPPTKDQPSTTPSEPPKNNTYCDCDSCDLPVPDDCRSYLLCIEGSATLITCSEGLYYNPMSGTCDFEDNVDCESVACPSANGRFAYPHSCAHYMECVDGEVFVKRCPDDWRFDAKMLNCSRTNTCSDPDTSSEKPTSIQPTETSKNTESTERATTLTSDSPETFTTEITTEDRDPVTETSSVQTTYSPSTTTAKDISTVTTEEPFKPSISTEQPSTVSTQDQETTAETSTNTMSSTIISTVQPTTEYTTISKTTLNEVTTTEETPKTVPTSSSTTIFTEYTTVSSTTSNEVTTSEETPTTASEKLPTAISTEQPTTEYTTVSKTTSKEVTTTEETPTASEKLSTTISTAQPTTEYTTVSNTTSKEVTTTEETPTTASAKLPTAISTEQPTTEYTTVSSTTLTKGTSTSGGNRTSISPLNFECPSRFGLFADPENCLRFYHCSHWIAHHKWCPSDLHFNPTLQVCDWPYRAGCGEKPKPTLVPTPEEDNSPENNTNCDCECCFTPDPKDCSRYSLCLDGRSHEGQCANGLLFNPLNDNCDLAERVSCSKNPIECTKSDRSVGNPKNCSSFYECVSGTPVLKQCPSGNHFSRSEKSCVEPCKAKCDQTLDCPNTSSTPVPKSEICIEDEALYRASDCSSFYQCTEGQAYLVQCPYGLHFNIEYGVCEHPCDALCDPNIECKLRRKRSLLCPSPNGLFPVPHDCGSFYMCSDGVEHWIHCPPGLHFNAIGGTCEEPCKALCNKTACKSSNTTSNVTPQNPDYNILSSNCKSANGIFPNPKDCGSFYQCKNGIEDLVYCPVGLHFSVGENICESPCVANCDISIEDCPTEIPDDEGNCTCHDCYLPDPTDCSAFYFCSQRHLTKGYCPYGTLFDIQKSRCEPEKNAVCETVADPVMCSSPFGFDPYPGDCGKFVHCVDSVAYVKGCEPGLEFDPLVRACANPNGRCGRKRIDSSCLTPTGTFPHPDNLSLFYQCEYGVAYLKECPFPLTFNSIDEVCDWPTNAQNEGLANIYLSEGKAVSDECSKVPGVICPCACRVTTYDECNSFYQCQQEGTACKKFCPEGLYFNKRKMVCDLPENVECRDFFFTAMNKLRSLN